MIPGAVNIAAQGGFQFKQGLSHIGFSIKPEGFQMFVDFSELLPLRFAFVHPQSPFLFNLPIEMFLTEKSVIKHLRVLQKVVSGVHGVAEMSSVTLAGKTQQPLQTPAPKTGPYIQRGAAPEQVFDFMLNGSGSTQGAQGTDCYQPAITVGYAGSDFVLFNDAHLSPGFHQVVRAGQTDDTAADDENVAMSGHMLK
jgi:hypothetical protein